MQILEVFLRGERDYVQGTQMIARVADAASLEGGVFQQAEFHRKTLNRVALDVDGAATPEDTVAKVHFQAQGQAGLQSYSLCELPDQATRRDIPLPIAVARQSGPDASFADATDASIWQWRDAQGFEDVLNAIVQIIRGEHSVRWPGSRDVWLTGFRRLNLPVAPAKASAGTMQLKLWRRMGAGVAGAEQTVWQFDLPELGVAGMSTFAFKPAGVSDGH